MAYSVRWRSAVLAAGFALLAAATLWALDRYARAEFTAHLRDSAAASLALAATGGTPYEWRFRNPDDLIAGHPFGAARFDFSDDGLRLEDAREAVEVGLPRTQSIDLAQFPLFHIVLDAQVGVRLHLLVRESLDAPTLWSPPLTLPGGDRSELSVDLTQLQWSDHGAAPRLPTRIAMMRLRFDPAPQGPVLLREVRLGRSAVFARLDLGRPIQVVEAGQAARAGALIVERLPEDVPAQKAAIESAAATRAATGTRLFVLPQRARVEQQMAIRNALHAALPEAILLPESALQATLQQAREFEAQGLPKTKASTQWNLAVLLAVAFLLGRLRPPSQPRLRALVEIVLTFFVPAWMVLGDGANAPLHAPQTVMVVMSVLYAISLSIPRTWSWIGPRGAWMLAGGVAAIALLLGLAFHQPDAEPAGVSGLRHVARYLVWALLQQYLVCAICAERWRTVTGSSLAAVYLAALGFALLHTPNAALMLATFIGGLGWCAIWMRYRALLPLALSHAASALLISSLLPAEILHSAEVSARFFH